MLLVIKLKLTLLSYQILPNITFLLSVFGILLIVLRHLPEAASSQQQEQPQLTADKKLLQKGLPAQAISRLRFALSFATGKLWNFILEAKDLKPHAAVGYQMKKIFGGKLPTFTKQASPPVSVVRDESYLLEIIRLQPKNLKNYDNLGKYYLEQGNTSDAKDIYQYLVNHQPTNSEYQARLGYCFYFLKNFPKAVEHYQKSTNLDNTQPNRYYNLSLSLDASGKKREALMAVKKALDLEPQNEKFIRFSEKLKK